MLTEEQIVSAVGQSLVFDELIAPVSIDEFLRDYWHQKPCHIVGPSTKFHDLFSWNDLNALLESHHFTYPRFRMSKDGSDVAPKEYMENLRFTKGTRVEPDGIRRQFTQGATIVLQHADEFCPRLQPLAEALRTAFGWHAEVEVIAGSGTSNGLPLHFDSNDCLVFQISGAKSWRVYEPTRTVPLRSSKLFPQRYDALPTPEPSREKPVLNVEVKAGHFIYIPRGWWHLVEPLPGPCLSLNPTVYSPTMQDMLRWLVDELSTEEACRENLSMDQDSQLRKLERLQEILTRSLIPETVERYRNFLLNEMEVSHPIRLPYAQNDAPPLTTNSAVRIRGGMPAHVTASNNSTLFRLRWRSQDLHFPYDDLAVFQNVNDGNYHNVSDIISCCSNAAERMRGISFLLNLSEKGIIEVGNGQDDSSNDPSVQRTRA